MSPNGNIHMCSAVLPGQVIFQNIKVNLQLKCNGFCVKRVTVALYYLATLFHFFSLEDA